MVFKPLRIGIYGVSGVGKSTLIQSLEKYNQCLQVVDGSQVIDDTVAGGLQAFKAKDLAGKTADRLKAVACLQGIHSASQKHTVIAGHYSFATEAGYDVAWTEADANFYDVIFLLHKSPERVWAQNQSDQSRKRDYSIRQLQQWQEYERQGLEEVCEQRNISLYPLDGELNAEELESAFIEKLSEAVITCLCRDITHSGVPSIALFDCDGTLNHDDIYNFSPDGSPEKITTLFKKYPAYCQKAFWDVSNYLDFDLGKPVISKMVEQAKRSLTIHPVMLKKLSELRENGTAIVFVSCGFPEAWNTGDFQADYLIGGASFGLHGCIMTHSGKRLLAELLTQADLHVVGFGNGSVDIDMLKCSDKAFYVYSNTINPRHIARLEGHEDLNLIKLEGM